MLCPHLIGRDRELAVLRARVAGLGERRGGVVVLVGDAGAGKSRLTREVVDLAREHGAQVLAGRSVPGASPVPYRPLSEALLAAYRNAPPPSDLALDGFLSHLGRLVPAWAADAPSADGSSVLLAEGIARLFAGHPIGTVLVLEDLHWADPETLAVVDYLADALRAENVLVVATSRPGGASADLVERLRRRDPGSVLAVAALDAASVEEMLAACLATTPPGDVVEFVRAHSDGSPFLVEELLAGLVASDALRRDDEDGRSGGWITAGPLRATVPADLRASIRQRMDALEPDAQRVLAAAALLGRRFDWELLPGIAEVDGRSAADALRGAVREQLIEATGDGFRFRHALTREAVLADLLPPERRDLAARAWPAHERANPGLPGPTLELAADLAESAGDAIAAARHLAESAKRALSSGALVSAESTARRAFALATREEATAIDVTEVLARVLLAAGRPLDARRVGRTLVERLSVAEGSAPRRADLLVLTAWAALAAGRDAVGLEPDPALEARIDGVAASVAYDRADLAEAERLARTAADAAADQPDVRAEALIVLGQVVRTNDGMVAAAHLFREAGSVAVAAGLAHVHLRAEQELAILAWTEGDMSLLGNVRALAARYGALVTVALMDLVRADIALATFERDACLRAAQDCADACRRFGLSMGSVADLWLAGAHALAGDRAAMEASIADALAPDPDDPRILADLSGRVLLTAAIVDDDLDRIPALLDTMIEHVRNAPPTTSVYPGRLTWALVHTIEDDDLGAPARAELALAAERIGLPIYTATAEMIDAVADARAGDHQGASKRIELWLETARAMPFGAVMLYGHLLLVARAAHRDGWGDPVRWVREADAFFSAGGYDRIARRCRLLLGEWGEPMPRKGRGETDVPIGLRALGVTSREVDVVSLVVAGASNKDIAEALFVSPKTVERHLSSLFARLGVANRRALAAAAAPHMGEGDR